MPEKEWYTYQEIATLLGVEMDRLYTTVSMLRRVGLVKTMPNPINERQKFIHYTSIDAIRSALPNSGQKGIV